LLVFLAAHRDRRFTEDEIVASVRPALISASVVREHLALFLQTGLVTEENSRFAYHPSSHALELQVHELVRAYHEKPVTLISSIYRVAARKFRTLDAPLD
jgi:hypothetical protein